MPLGGPPVTVVEAGGLPVTNLGAAGGTPMTVVEAPLYGMPITLVEGAYPVSLLDEDGNFWSDGPAGASDLLEGETNGLAIDFTLGAGFGSVAVKDTTTPANVKTDVPVDAFLTQSGTSPKLVLGPTGVYGWSPHNLFVNSTSAPATQSVTTLIIGATYTYGITGTGSLTGSSGASGVATAATPVSFVATGTTGTFTVAGSVTSMWINRGPAQSLPYHATGAAPWFGVPIEYSGGGYYGLVEPQATNLVARSQEVDTWVTAGATITANATTAPDGTVTADKMVEAVGGTFHWAYRDAVLTAAPHTASICLKAAERSWCYLRFDPGVSNGAWFNLAAGTIGTVQAGITAAITALGNGWYRCAVTATATAANWFFVPGVSTGDGVEVYAGDGVSGMYAWGAQVETGLVATSPIPTFAATVTRAADIVSAPITTFPLSSTVGTWLARFTLPVGVSGAARIIANTTAFVTPMFYQGVLDFFDGTSIPGTVPITPSSAIQKAAIAYSGVTGAGSVNGGAVGSRAFDGDFGFTGSMSFGGSFDTSDTYYVKGRLYSFVYVPRRMTDAELQTKTAP